MVVFCNAGRYSPLINLQRTCSFVSCMVVFCNVGRYSPLINLQRTSFLCPIWSCFASAGRYTPPPLPAKLNSKGLVLLCPVCSCFTSCDSCSDVLCRTKKFKMLPKERRQNRQKESQQIIGGGSQTGTQRETEREAHFPTLFTLRTKSRPGGPSPLSPGDNWQDPRIVSEDTDVL